MREADSPAEDPGAEPIDLRSGPSMDHWTQQLGLSREQIAAVVAIVGEQPGDVQAYLKEHGTPTTPE